MSETEFMTEVHFVNWIIVYCRFSLDNFTLTLEAHSGNSDFVIESVLFCSKYYYKTSHLSDFSIKNCTTYRVLHQKLPNLSELFIESCATSLKNCSTYLTFSSKVVRLIRFFCIQEMVENYCFLWIRIDKKQFGYFVEEFLG